MFTLHTVKERGITAVIGLTEQKPILEVITRLALISPVQLIVGGNRFDAHQLTRMIRKQTLLLDTTLERIQLARPFTCHQTITLLTETEPATPIIMIDMLQTFYDENISDAESFQFVCTAARHLRRFGQQAPVLITLRPPSTPTRAGLSKLVRGIADQVYVYDAAVQPFQPPLL